MVVKVVFSDISKCLLSVFLLSHDKRLVRNVKVLPDCYCRLCYFYGYSQTGIENIIFQNCLLGTHLQPWQTCAGQITLYYY